MPYAELAAKLIAAESAKKRKSLLNDFREYGDVKLAQALKNTAYESWTSKPQKVRRAAQSLKILFELEPNAEIEAIALWVAGIDDLTKGRLVSAIAQFDRAADFFRAIEKEFEAAQTQVAKLYALALLGKYEQAIDCGSRALKIFEKYSDELAAGKIEKNLGNIVSRQELHFEAEKYYLAARRRFLKIKNLSELTMCENGLAMTYSALNDFRRAEKFYASALNHARKAKMSVTEAEIEASIGNLALFRGKYDEALKFLESSRQKYEALQMPHQTATAELEIADVYLELNLNAEAFAAYEKVSGKLGRLKMQGEEARARASFGRVAAILNDTQTARKQLKKAARLYESEKNKIGAATTKLNEAKLELDLQNYQSALNLAREAEKNFGKLANPRHFLNARQVQAEALRNLNKTVQARKMFAGIFRAAVRHEQPNLAQAAQIALGKIAVERRNFRQAEKHFEQAIRLIESLRAPLAAEEFRMAFLANKLAPFENLAKIYLAESNFEKAFLMIEKSRSRSLAEKLNETIQPSNDEQNDALVKLSRRIKFLREELNWFYSRLSRAEESAIGKLQAEVKKRETQIADLSRQIANIGESNFGEQNPLDLLQLQRQIGKEKALLEFVNFDGNLAAFVVSDEEIKFAANLGKESEILSLLEDLQFQFGSLRYGAAALNSFLPDLKKRADFYLQKLYEKLVAPLEKLIENRNLVIVPVGALHYVPFHALFDGAKYQIEWREIVHTPGATVWQFLASKPERKLKNALFVGFADERIPLVTQEIAQLKNIFAASKSLTGKQATFSAFTENAANFDILHLACHGQFRPENPMFSSLHLADGWITVRDVCSQRLRAEIVTLSACETGLNKIFAGDEILGLARGFLAAGAKSLILSLWTVNDEATMELMRDFYQNLQIGKTVSASLRSAQINFIERQAHPYFWSPFALIGR